MAGVHTHTDKICHAKRGENNGNPLRKTQAFLEKNDSQQDAHQWIDEITEAGFNDVIRIDRPNINKPVDADQNSGN